jgi:hypothetical protein
MTYGNENIGGPKCNPISRMNSEERTEKNMWRETVVPQCKARLFPEDIQQKRDRTVCPVA